LASRHQRHVPPLLEIFVVNTSFILTFSDAASHRRHQGWSNLAYIGATCGNYQKAESREQTWTG
jgi:hypothetical protein